MLGQGSVSDRCRVQLARSGQAAESDSVPSISSCLLPDVPPGLVPFFGEILVPQLWTFMCHQFKHIMK